MHKNVVKMKTKNKHTLHQLLIDEGYVIEGTEEEHFYPGQKVWWNDPDDGLSSDFYTVREVCSETVWFVETETEVPFHELEIVEYL